MKTPTNLMIATVFCAAVADTAVADERVKTLCGEGHLNEILRPDDVSANPDGYYVAPLKTQLTLGDPRIVPSNDGAFYLCTRSAATPEMDATMAALLQGEREVSWLFVPICPKTGRPGA